MYSYSLLADSVDPLNRVYHTEAGRVVDTHSQTSVMRTDYPTQLQLGARNVPLQYPLYDGNH